MLNKILYLLNVITFPRSFSTTGFTSSFFLKVPADSGIKHTKVGNTVRMGVHVSESEAYEGFGTAIFACILPNDRDVIGGLFPTGVSDTGFYACPYVKSRLSLVIACKCKAYATAYAV